MSSANELPITDIQQTSFHIAHSDNTNIQVS